MTRFMLKLLAWMLLPLLAMSVLSGNWAPVAGWFVAGWWAIGAAYLLERLR